MIYGKGVHMYNGVGFALPFSLIFLKYRMKPVRPNYFIFIGPNYFIFIGYLEWVGVEEWVLSEHPLWIRH